MGKDRSEPLQEINFRCPACTYAFKCAPAEVRPDPAQEHHPYAYFAKCTVCGCESPQVNWEKALIKGWANATGPKTPEGKAASAANLEGHPTAEEAQRTRFNAMKHGLSARVATYFPAKPDGYAFCTTCDVDREWCAEQPACVKQTQLFMLHHAAFDQKNPKHLMGIYADLQAAVFAVLQQILQTIIADGVEVVTPKYRTDEEGKIIVAEWFDERGQRHIIKEVERHPLFAPLGELLTRANLNLHDMGMTARVIDDDEAELGRLTVVGQGVVDASNYARENAGSLAALREMAERAQSNARRDPVLIEHKQQQGG